MKQMLAVMALLASAAFLFGQDKPEQTKTEDRTRLRRRKLRLSKESGNGLR